MTETASEPREPTRTCNCAAIAPTMPVFRTAHLPSCPMWYPPQTFAQVLAKMPVERQQELRSKLAEQQARMRELLGGDADTASSESLRSWEIAYFDTEARWIAAEDRLATHTRSLAALRSALVEVVTKYQAVLDANAAAAADKSLGTAPWSRAYRAFEESVRALRATLETQP